MPHNPVWVLLQLLSRTRTRPLFMLFLALVIDVGYGVLTYNTPYGCSGSPIQTSQTDQQQPLINWQVLANPCFYTIWFGIVGGSACIIILIPVPDKRQLSESEQGS